MSALPVVDDLEVLADRVGQRGPSPPAFRVAEFDLHAGPERLDDASEYVVDAVFRLTGRGTAIGGERPAQGRSEPTADRTSTPEQQLHAGTPAGTSTISPTGTPSCEPQRLTIKCPHNRGKTIASARRYLGEEAAAGVVAAAMDLPGTVHAPITVRPTWVGLLDFTTRLPSPLGGA
jgi:hypothetical protein